MGEKKPVDKISERYRIMVISFTLIFAVIVAQLVNLQIINGEYYDEQSRPNFWQKGILLLQEEKLSTGTEYPSLSIEWDMP